MTVIDCPFTRRSLFQGILGLTAASLVAGCSSPGGQASEGGSGGGAITWGSNNSDPDSRTAFADLISTATEKTGVTVKINNTDHETFQNNISNYLQGTPDDAFNWFAGYRLQYLAAQGLTAPIDDVWDKIGGHFSEAQHTLAKGADGKYYFVPCYQYPWVVFHSKKLFQEKGYSQPKRWEELLALCERMKGDGLVPFAFGNKETWPALGTFDILNLRLNGYDYHMKLLRHEIPWTDRGITEVFTHWAQILPYYQSGGNGRAWQDAAKALENGQAGMMYQGTAQVAPAYAPENVDDLDFFVYPAINDTHGTQYLEAPTDGFMLSSKAKQPKAAKRVLEWMGTPEAESRYMKSQKWQVGAAKDIPQDDYNEIQKKSSETLSQAKAVSQFFDTDTDPAMGSAMTKLLQQFINDPSEKSIASIQQSAESQAAAIFQ